MSQQLSLKAKGLYTNVNELSEAPVGSMSIADNVVINRDGIVESRRGFDKLAYLFYDLTYRALGLYTFKDFLIAHYGTPGSENLLAWYDSSLTILTGTTTNGSASVTGLSSTTSLNVGMTVTGTGIAAQTYISAIPGGTSLTLSQPAIASGSVSLTFAGWRNYTGTYSVPDVALGKIRSAESNSNIYFATGSGIKKLDAINGTIVNAGGIKAIDGTAALSGATGFMTTNTQVAYRVVWGYKDANNNLILGSPSQRITVANATGGTRDVSLTISIPTGITTSYFYQLYRSGMSASSTDEADDELNLVYETNPTSAEIIAKSLTVIDSTPESLRNGAALYTNPSQEGILAANEIPPYAKDVAVFRNVMFYANTKTKQRLSLTLLSVGGSSGVNYVAITADTTNTSATILNLSTTTGVTAGQSITGTGIPASTTISSVQAQLVTTGDITNTSPVIINIPSTSTLLAGMTVTGVGIPAGAKILTVDSPTQVTLTANATATTPSLAITFGSKAVISHAATATNSGASVAAFDTVTIAGTTYLASNTEDATTLKFKIDVSGTPAQNVDSTAKSLIRVINTNSTNTTVYGFYLSSFNDLPGIFLIEERALGGSTYYATASSHGTAWNSPLPTSGTTVASTNDSFVNGLSFSKVQQPEAVPIVNTLRIGSADRPIYRIIALRQALYILKQDGIFRLTGTDPTNFRVDLFDNTAVLIAPETAQALNNQIFMLADQGVVAVSDSGVSVISRPIENTLLRLYSLNLTAVQQYSFAVGYETERLYVLGIISASDDTAPTQLFCYNTFTNTWVRWPLNKLCGLIRKSDGKIYFGDGASNSVNFERKDRNYTDYVDDQISTTLVSFVGKALVVTDPSGIAVGDIVFQSTTAATLVTAVDSSTATITVSDTITWSLGAISILKAFTSIVEFSPLIGKNPGILKQWREVSLFFKDVFFTTLDIGFTSDLSGNRETVNFAGLGVGLWGLVPWGSGTWGGSQRAIAVRTYVPKAKQRCSQLTIRITHTEGYALFSLNGLSLIYNVISEKLRR